MTLLPADLTLSQEKFNELFPLTLGKVEIAGGKRAGQTAGMARYTVLAGKKGREHVIELGYGTVPERDRKKQDYPLLLPKLDSELGRFNIDGNTNNILILKFRENRDKKLVLESLRNFNAPRAIEAGPGHNERLAVAVMEIAQLRIRDILENKINVQQEPQALISLIHHAIEMRAGHMFRQHQG